MKTIGVMIGISLVAIVSPAALMAQCYVLAPQYRVGSGPFEKCSVAACTEGYSPTAFSSEQAKICAEENKKHPAPKSELKIYKSDNGTRFVVDLGKIHRTGLGPEIFGGIIGTDSFAKPIVFDCHGHAILSPGNNWMTVPSHSVLGQVEKDVCARFNAFLRHGTTPPEATHPAEPPQATETTPGLTQDQVEAIYGPPISITTTGTKHVYTYRHFTFILQDGKLSEFRQIQ